MAAVALKEGWFKDKVGGLGLAASATPGIARRRRGTQALRKVRDRELAGPPDARSSAGDGPVPGVLRAANPRRAQYWRLVRRAL